MVGLAVTLQWGQTPGGTYLEKGYGDVGQKKTPFSRSLCHSARPPSQYFSVSQDPNFNQKSQNFPVFCSKCLNWVDFQFLDLKICQNPVQQASFWAKSQSAFLSKKRNEKSVQQAPYLPPVHTTSPHFQPYQNESWVPLPWDKPGYIIHSGHTCAFGAAHVPVKLYFPSKKETLGENFTMKGWFLLFPSWWTRSSKPLDSSWFTVWLEMNQKID